MTIKTLLFNGCAVALISGSVSAQSFNPPVETPPEPTEIQAMPPLLDLENSAAIEKSLVAAYRERAVRENYWGDVDEAAGYPRRFGPKKEEDYYVIQYYQAQAREKLERESSSKDQMLQDALAKEKYIREHYGYAVTTIKDFEGQIRYWQTEANRLKAKFCKRGKKC